MYPGTGSEKREKQQKLLHSHANVPGRRGAERSYQKAAPGDHPQGSVAYPAHSSLLHLRGARRSQDVAQHDEGKQEHSDLGDSRVLHLEEALGPLLNLSLIHI